MSSKIAEIIVIFFSLYCNHCICNDVCRSGMAEELDRLLMTVGEPARFAFINDFVCYKHLIFLGGK